MSDPVRLSQQIQHGEYMLRLPELPVALRIQWKRLVVAQLDEMIGDLSRRPQLTDAARDRRHALFGDRERARTELAHLERTDLECRERSVAALGRSRA